MRVLRPGYDGSFGISMIRAGAQDKRKQPRWPALGWPPRHSELALGSARRVVRTRVDLVPPVLLFTDPGAGASAGSRRVVFSSPTYVTSLGCLGPCGSWKYPITLVRP